jgi:hypothetical protein
MEGLKKLPQTNAAVCLLGAKGQNKVSCTLLPVFWKTSLSDFFDTTYGALILSGLLSCMMLGPGACVQFLAVPKIWTDNLKAFLSLEGSSWFGLSIVSTC